ncbi:MAG: LysR substrate-binding domain-containing protein [Sandaracinaceae bacterium]
MLVASEGYLARHGLPAQAADLPEHQLLVWAAPGEDPTQVRLRRGGHVEVRPALRSPDIHLLLELAGAGLGIAYAPWMSEVPFQGGQAPPALTPILTESVAEERALRVVVPAAMEGIPRIRALLREVRLMSAAFVEVSRGAGAVARI